MLDSGSPHGRGPRHIKEGVSQGPPTTLSQDYPQGYWLMRRELRQIDARLVDTPRPWPGNSRRIAFSPDIAPQLHGLLVAGYRHGGGSVPAYEAWRASADTGPEADPSLWIITADDYGLTGAAHCWTSAFIRDLVVHPRARRQGLALALLSHAFYQFQLRGEANVDLNVLEDNHAARSLYETSGMRYVLRTTAD
jgi:ribosomal protein S18 acetylase RimI-like enzyme